MAATCPECGDEFPTKRGMKSHYGQVHEGSIAGIRKKCESCDEPFTAATNHPGLRHCSNECRRNRITVPCDNCGEELERIPWRVEENERQFCDQDCHGEWLAEHRAGETSPLWKPRIAGDCAWCGDTVERRQSHPDVERLFCDHACYGKWVSENNVGENNPNWAGGYRDYYGRNWLRQRELAIEAAGRQCERCGLSEADHKQAFGCSLSVHHIEPFRSFDDPGEANELSNLMALCKHCHARWEGIPLRVQTAD